MGVMKDMTVEQLDDLAEAMEKISIYEFVYLSAAVHAERISGKFVFTGKDLCGISKNGVNAVLGKNLFLSNFVFPFAEAGGNLYRAGCIDYDAAGVFATEKGKQLYSMYIAEIGDTYIGATLDAEATPKCLVDKLVTDIREKALELYLLMSLRGALKRNPQTKRIVVEAEKEQGTVFFPMALDRVSGREESILLGEANVGGVNSESFADLLNAQTEGAYAVLRAARQEDGE